MWKSAGRAPSLRVIPWHLPYNWGKSRGKNLSLGKKNLSGVCFGHDCTLILIVLITSRKYLNSCLHESLPLQSSPLIPRENISLVWIYWSEFYLLTPWSRALLEKLTGSQLVKQFPTFYGTRSFITAFTNARHMSLSWTSSIPSIPPRPTAWRSILILSSHLRLGLPSGLFPSGFPTKTLYTPLHSTIRAICPAYLILIDFITRTIFGGQFIIKLLFM